MPKIFVLDTSVIIFDYEAILHFDEHDVAIPITVLEELDQFKKGNSYKNFAAREFVRFIDNLAEDHSLQDWVPISGPNKGKFCVVQDQNAGAPVGAIFGADKPDHHILGVALNMKERHPDREIVLVTMDVSLRLKAKSLGLAAQDYMAGQIENRSESLYSGTSFIQDVPSPVIDDIFVRGMIDPATLPNYTNIPNHFHVLKNGRKSALACMDAASDSINLVTRSTVFGVEPRNAEQTFALHVLLNPAIKLVTLQGVAGTGKTLLALASALEQRKLYKQIYIARPVVPLSNKDIGYLPGDVNSKMHPYMEPLWDNLRFIKGQYSDHSREFKQITEMVSSGKIEIIPLTYIRGRSLSNVFIIIDEAQNLTPHEVKTIITRAGENTKIVFTGDIHQIDTPYLDIHSNGLSHLIEKLKGQSLFAHITLEKGERSELANLANDLL